MTKAGKDTIEEKPSLIANYRPLRLKAVVAATAVKGKVPEEKKRAGDEEIAQTLSGYPEMPFSD